MKVILLADVKSVGKKGETVTVADGYGRNVLLAKKLGVEATAQNMNNLKLQKLKHIHCDHNGLIGLGKLNFPFRQTVL
jgi:ribosomal protein L9